MNEPLLFGIIIGCLTVVFVGLNILSYGQLFRGKKLR
uniref:Cytochrome b6/f complex subunit V n=2 Tax=Chromera velia TaxID=505693 RepID=D9IXG2_9ALVE|nr:cytochrome b6/f complex subunit V [Chromera velia]ADJ66570.1 cytochrome b6/f complex subunit V [Chromera velia]